MVVQNKNYFLRFNSLFLLFFIFFNSCSKPDYEIFNGSSGYLEDFDGKWLVVNYWADWCPPCIKEMPELTSFYEQNKAQVTVLAYNFDRLEGKELEEQILRFKVKVPSILTDPGGLFGWETPPSLPATFLVDPEGNTKEMLIGPQTQEGLELLIEKYK